MKPLTDTEYIHILIAEGEHQQQDFKFEISDARKIARTLSAFSNTDGGRLLIGVKDNGKIAGVRSDEEKYMIVNMNPNEKKEAFEINKKEMQFDTNKFYQYVFADIEAEMEIEILDTTNDQDKAAKRVYNIISEITSEVMKKMNEKCFTELT